MFTSRLVSPLYNIRKEEPKNKGENLQMKKCVVKETSSFTRYNTLE